MRGARRVLGARDVWGVLPGLGARRIARQRFTGHLVIGGAHSRPSAWGVRRARIREIVASHLDRNGASG